MTYHSTKNNPRFHPRKMWISGFIIAMFSVLPGVASANDLYVKDGDSFVLNGEEVRLWGVDAMELSQFCQKDRRDYPCGQLAKVHLQNLIGRRINLKVEEIGRPDLQAQLVAEKISEQLQRRASFRRTMKRAAEESMDAGAKGIKVQLAGRLGGAEMARREKHISGSIPLSTIRAKISYGFSEALTAQGHIGVQVWINQGNYGDEIDGSDAKTGQASKGPKRSYKR